MTPVFLLYKEFVKLYLDKICRLNSLPGCTLLVNTNTRLLLKLYGLGLFLSGNNFLSNLGSRLNCVLLQALTVNKSIRRLSNE